MADIFAALVISTGLLLPVVVIVIFASIAAVRRGEAELHGVAGGHGVDVSGDVHEQPVQSEASESGRFSFIPDRDPSVLEILAFGTVLFALTMGLLFAFSILQQM